MRFNGKLPSLVIVVLGCFIPGISANEIVVFDDVLHFGNLLDQDRNGNMTSFEIRESDPYEGAAHLARDFDGGEWAWVNGIENMGIDLTEAALDFEKCFVEFYIDSGPYAIEYIELRFGNQQWSVSDVQYIMQTDNIEGYQRIKVMCADFHVTGTQEVVQDWDDFTAGELTDRVSWGFGPDADVTLLIDSIRIADQTLRELKPGDADQDLDFDQFDLVQVQIAAKYLTGQSATWGEGDWNGAPGGSPGDPPLGDGLFNQIDIIAALAASTYLTGPYSALQPDGRTDDDRASIVDNVLTDEVTGLPTPTDMPGLNVSSTAGLLIGNRLQDLWSNLGTDTEGNDASAPLDASFGCVFVAEPRLFAEPLRIDHAVVEISNGTEELSEVELVYVPEQATALLLAVGLLFFNAFTSGCHMSTGANQR
jgi:hypothetical protein